MTYGELKERLVGLGFTLWEPGPHYLTATKRLNIAPSDRWHNSPDLEVAIDNQKDVSLDFSDSA